MSRGIERQSQQWPHRQAALQQRPPVQEELPFDEKAEWTPPLGLSHDFDPFDDLGEHRHAGKGIDWSKVEPGLLVDEWPREQDPDDYSRHRPYSGPLCQICNNPPQWVPGPGHNHRTSCRHGAIEGRPADADYFLDRDNPTTAWVLHKERQHGKPLSQFTEDDWAIAGEPPSRTARVRLAMPMPTNLALSNEQPADGGSHGMKVYQDHQGDWTLKQPKPSLAFTVPLEHAAASLQRRMGLEAPETHVIDHQGRPAVVSKWYPGSHQEWNRPPRLAELDPDDQMTVQKNHVLDWLIGNHDAHVGNWIRTGDGKLVSIDKGQAVKYFGHDRLDPHFHPNYAREPIYNQLFRDHAKGHGQLHDPRAGELGDFVKGVQSIPDDELKGMFRPYAQAAAASGLLLNPDNDPARELGPRALRPNDPEHFLDALVARKNNLHNDLGQYYDRMTPGRQLVGWRTAGVYTYDDDEASTPAPGKWRFENGDEAFHIYGPSQDEAWKKYLDLVGCDCCDDPEDHEYGEDEENPLENTHVEEWDDPKYQYTHLKQLTDPQLFKEWNDGYDPETDPFDPRQFEARRVVAVDRPGPDEEWAYSADGVADFLDIDPEKFQQFTKMRGAPAPTHVIDGEPHWNSGALFGGWRNFVRDYRNTPGSDGDWSRRYDNNGITKGPYLDPNNPDPYLPRNEGWMYRPDANRNLQRQQLELQPWQDGELPRPEYGNTDPNFARNNGYIKYNPYSDIPHRWGENPDSLVDWKETLRAMPGPGQMDLFGGEDHDGNNHIHNRRGPGPNDDTTPGPMGRPPFFYDHPDPSR